MNKIEWDKEDFEKELAGFLCKFFGVGELEPSTPMHEIRARLELVGVMLGRSLAVCLHEGPISADIAMAIRASEIDFKARTQRSLVKTFGIEGEVRKRWSQTPLDNKN